MNAARQFELRWVYQAIFVKGRVHESGQRPALCVRGRKHALCIAAGHPVRVLKRTLDAYDRYREVAYIPPLDGPTPEGATPRGAIPYPVSRALGTLREVAERNGITRGARLLLERAEAWVASDRRTDPDINEDDFHDEEEELREMENPKPVEIEPTTTEETKMETTQQQVGTKRIAPRRASTKPAARKAARSNGNGKSNGRGNGARAAKVAKSAKGTAAKKAKSPRGSAPRAGTMTEMIVNLTRSGKSNKDIGNAVAKAFPGTGFQKVIKKGDYTPVAWYQGQARKRGWLPKGK